MTPIICLIRTAVLLVGAAGGPALAQATDTTGQASPPAAPAAPEPAAPAAAPIRTLAPRDAYVYSGWPQDGTVIRSTRFKIWFGSRNIGVAPAGVGMAGTGHHHLLIDAPLPSDMGAAIPNDKNHLHFGAGQTETVLELPPGPHTLQLLMADGAHVPHDPPLYSRQITIQVRPGPAPRVAAGR